MKKSIFIKVFCAFFSIVVILSALILIFSFKTIRSHYIDTLTLDLKNLGITLILKVKPLLEKGRFEELDALAKKLGKDISTRITIIDPEGVVLADSEENPKLMENHKIRPEVLQVLNGDVGTSLRFSSTVKEEMLYVAQPIEQDGRILGVLRVSLFLKDINSLLYTLKINITCVVFIIILISLLGAAIFTRSLSKPIRELSNASRKVASGDFNVRVLLKRKDELKELADSFNYMTNQIRTLFTELSRQKEGLNNIISSIQEGLLVFDQQGRIILTNESFKKIVESNHIEGRFYWEVVREPLVSELIKKVRDEKISYTEELVLNGKWFLCSATFLDSREETVVIFHDITEMKNVEEIKKDFVVNVSHELRTPLTAIKGFAETLEEETDEKNRHYVDIIKRNTDRLINIVQDLLALSQLEERGTRLELEEVDLG
ncbi:MAG: HAMP domain-containing protein, partial [Deltaproteobacteria bacterium]|nr:HAMP domain-containing protein [Deltaproteobacteria bacterium]